MYRYIKLLGWGILLATVMFFVAGYVSLAVADEL